MRLPAVIDYPIGERVFFRAGPHTESIPARIIMKKGNNTAWLTRKNSDGSEKTLLASFGQIAPCPSSEVSFLPVTDIYDVPLPRSPENVPVAIAAPAADNVSEATEKAAKGSSVP